MGHTEKYLQAKWVTENPDGYDDLDVVDAKKYCNAYLDGYNRALHNVVGQSEQLLDFLEWKQQVAVDDLTDKEIVEFYLARKVKQQPHKHLRFDASGRKY